MIDALNPGVNWGYVQQGPILRSPEQGELIAALHAFQSEIGIIGEGSYNPFFKSTYADLADVFKIAVPIATKHGLTVSQHPTGTVDNPTLTSILQHISGQWQQSETPLYLEKKVSQGHGAAITYMRRYTYCAILGIVSDPDDDGNSSGQTSSAAPARASGPIKKAKTFAEAAAKKPAKVPQPDAVDYGTGESASLSTQRAEILSLARTLAPSRSAAAVKTFIGQQGRAAFGDGFTTHDALTQGEADVFISNLKVMQNGQPANEKVSDPDPAPNLDTEEF